MNGVEAVVVETVATAAVTSGDRVTSAEALGS